MFGKLMNPIIEEESPELDSDFYLEAEQNH